MTVWYYRTKDIRPGDIVLYLPPGPMDKVGDLIGTGTVLETEQRINCMRLTVDWGTPDVPRVVDVNDVEVLRREG